MSGECEDCGEHVTDCRCVEGKLRDEVDMLQDTVMTHSYKLAQVFEFINNPAFEDYKRQLDVLRSKLDNTNSSINEIIHKCEDNMRRLNHMMLEMKGVISQASAKAKLFVPKNDIPQKD